MPADRTSPLARYRRGLATSTVNNSSAFGFSVMVTATFGLLSHLHGAPVAWEVVGFALGAVSAVAGIEAGVSRGFRRRPRPHPSNVVLLGTAGNLGSVAVALGAGYGAGAVLPAPVAWPLAPLLAAAAYLLAEAGGLALAERLEANLVGEQQAEAPD